MCITPCFSSSFCRSGGRVHRERASVLTEYLFQLFSLSNVWFFFLLCISSSSKVWFNSVCWERPGGPNRFITDPFNTLLLSPSFIRNRFHPVVENFALILFVIGNYYKESKERNRCLGKALMHLALISSVLKYESEKLDAAIIVF